MTRCTVFGANGFIGQALAQALINAGYDVQKVGRDDHLDLSMDLGHVFYCIGMTADFRNRPFDTVQAHVSLLADVLKRSRFQSFLYLSSTRVYTGTSNTHEDVSLVVRPKDPSDLYNLSKLMGESICLHSGKPNCRVVRLSNVVGFDPCAPNFHAELIREALSGCITLRTALDSEKDYILLRDAIGLIMKIGIHGRARIYNVASGVNLAHKQWCETLARATGCSVRCTSDAQKYWFPPIDITQVQREFGFLAAPVLEAVPDLVERFWKCSDQ